MPKLDADVQEELLRYLRQNSVARTDISVDTEIYYDLRIYGDAFDDLIEWAMYKFDVTFNDLNQSKFEPGEGFSLLDFIAELLGFRLRKSFTVGMLQVLIEKRRENVSVRG